MANDDKDFLARWARLKREGGERTQARPAAQTDGPPALPPLDQLTPDSDFKDFMHAKVADGVRRAALKKLFADPRFNVMDALDIYIDDYRDGGIVSAEMLADLEHSKTTLFGPRQDPQAKDQEANAAVPQEVVAVPQVEEIKSDAPVPDVVGQETGPSAISQTASEDEHKEDGAAG